ncbi:MAG: hypothetical protein Q7S18_00265 [bacterium]|nr:hypothetical protein [bacterium]
MKIKKISVRAIFAATLCIISAAIFFSHPRAASASFWDDVRDRLFPPAQGSVSMPRDNFTIIGAGNKINFYSGNDGGVFRGSIAIPAGMTISGSASANTDNFGMVGSGNSLSVYYGNGWSNGGGSLTVSGGAVLGRVECNTGVWTARGSGNQIIITCNGPGGVITLTDTVLNLPTAVLDIQNSSGASISSTNTNTTVYLYAGGSSDPDGSIADVKFCSDDTPGNGGCDNGWTPSYNWTVNSGDWNASAKKMAWSFATAGNKGVYVQVRDNSGAWSNIAEDTINVLLPTFALTVSKAGAGSGNVAWQGSDGSSFSGFGTATYASGTTITLTATAVFGSDFIGWSGTCSRTGTCAVTMNAAKTVTAAFSPATCTAGCGACSESCGGGIQSCVRADCSTYSQSCNTDVCPTSGGSNWKEVAP